MHSYATLTYDDTPGYNYYIALEPSQVTFEITGVFTDALGILLEMVLSVIVVLLPQVLVVVGVVLAIMLGKDIITGVLLRDSVVSASRMSLDEQYEENTKERDSWYADPVYDSLSDEDRDNW